MKKWWVTFCVMFLLLFTACSERSQVMDGDGMIQTFQYTQISQDVAKEMMEKDDGHVIVDVRREDEYAEGHIPGAILIPNESIDVDPPEELPDPNQIILVYCRSGRRSKEASQKLADMGYSNVYEFGGIIDWTGDIEINNNNETENGGEEMGAAKLLYQGHASMRITTTEGKVIYVDPFAGEGYDVPADLILMTHGHYDHTQTDTITTKNPDCETISWEEALSGGQHQSFDLGYVKVEAVEAGYNKNHDTKQCVGFILTFSNGVTLYLSGDTSTTPQMQELAQRNLDYAFFCCDGVYNMDVQEAIECAKTVGAKHNIPYHMIPADKTNCFDQAVAESFDVPGRIILKPGEELVLE
ncbi:rhodanese-like domain-containing protein [Butyrivibrio sp. INlla16]|uniref:rhodanese-like domain-containing protein n=1 Tax=Butyrivibrio sp. INlla16 TaxID=1520807 RepID=UPI0008834682|nr:rhodanese-like domain-containing protein [Butyrivibrio sp. INlla16]SDB68604.1 Rhodanese-related sulfurtransferase [Butyrivibrio sp. INlla16]